MLVSSILEDTGDGVTTKEELAVGDRPRITGPGTSGTQRLDIKGVTGVIKPSIHPKGRTGAISGTPEDRGEPSNLIQDASTYLPIADGVSVEDL